MQKSWWQKYRKDTMIVLVMITTVLVGVMGWHWTDTSDKPFWSGFWNVAAVLADLIWIGAWAYFWNKDKRRR